jgi:hypothetical protein
VVVGGDIRKARIRNPDPEEEIQENAPINAIAAKVQITKAWVFMPKR